ncbi:hypothetical protein TPA0910_47710 [Streptomyces hygroscopicus subsp. sporocinereus]|uniref:DUF397 domain-containing protein n=1 Tax=Streptomyces hygroscopicus TaxID=1912 RepID=A0ABQ3U573_STRHY|nr:DUF397 domain-containing protein [Streptomyces hygroscopicus]GHJ30338.1 hypothetical protein TPA0910_47710 [Streptomyces hygroscopicus]
MHQPNWYKSTFSENQANCVELAVAPDGICIRESDEPDTVIRTSPTTLRSFIRAAKAASLDHIR